MRKKNALLYIAIISSIVFLILIIPIIYTKKSAQVGQFSLVDCQERIKEFPSDEVVGPVHDAKTAKEKAETVWAETYGMGIFEQKPYKVYFDEETDTWLVTGTLPPLHLGGVAYIIMQESDGKVLAVWHTK